ncbi:SufB/SufD family protein [Treponema pectinovorum]|uniref:SufB/SufD family protein n=1 Tax=Treponema pectinovorum TaxID=164 RepID=UPI0011CB6ECD|nr:SufD family Fe-S cluster assembly protein [Treponema pectinovorum]
MKKNLSYHNINEIPYLTWNWIKINRASLQAKVEEEITDSARVKNVPKGTKIFYDGDSKLNEIESCLPKTMEHKSSEDTTKIINSFAAKKMGILAQGECEAPLIINFDLKDGKTYCAKQSIVAEENANITIIFDYTSNKDADGFFALQTKIYAKQNSKIHLIKVQLLGENAIHLDDTQSLAEENASIKITQIELGSKKAFVNVTSNLEGLAANFKSETAYIAKNEQEFDFNYCTVHTGKKTDTKMDVKGSLADNASKTYRGTIDFRTGCISSTGDEQEETLLLSPNATNRSIPMILCGEEEISGTHGSTLGRLGSEELFYFNSRGISESEAKSILTRAKVMAFAQNIPDENLVQKISEYIGEE